MAKLHTFFLIIILAGLAACNNNDKQASQTTNDELKARGKEIAQQTLMALSKELKQALQQGGIGKAVPYCNVNALPLTDSMAKINKVSIRRTSLKTRNPKNAPNDREKQILGEYKQLLAEDKRPKPRLTNLADGRTLFNAPILIKPLCLNCHGKVGAQVTEKNYAVIKGLYPNDQAIGYKVAELRGMWSIVFEKGK